MKKMIMTNDNRVFPSLKKAFEHYGIPVANLAPARNLLKTKASVRFRGNRFVPVMVRKGWK